MNIRTSIFSLLLLAAVVGPAAAEDMSATPAAPQQNAGMSTEKPAAPAVKKAEHKASKKAMRKHKIQHHKKVKAAQ